MSAIAPPHTHIVIDDRGVPRIEGTRMRVTMIAHDRYGTGWSPEEIQGHYPHLTLAQVYAALAYYADNKAGCDALEASEQAEVEEYFRKQGPSPATQKLKDRGLVRSAPSALLR